MTSIYHSSDNSMHEQAIKPKEKRRIIPCSNPHSWEDGKEYVEGKDYEVLWTDEAEAFRVSDQVVVPIEPSNEDELWRSLMREIGNNGWNIKNLSSKFSITKR